MAVIETRRNRHLGLCGDGKSLARSIFRDRGLFLSCRWIMNAISWDSSYVSGWVTKVSKVDYVYTGDDPHSYDSWHKELTYVTDVWHQDFIECQNIAHRIIESYGREVVPWWYPEEDWPEKPKEYYDKATCYLPMSSRRWNVDYSKPTRWHADDLGDLPFKNDVETDN